MTQDVPDVRLDLVRCVECVCVVRKSLTGCGLCIRGASKCACGRFVYGSAGIDGCYVCWSVPKLIKKGASLEDAKHISARVYGASELARGKLLLGHTLRIEGRMVCLGRLLDDPTQ